MQVDTFGSADPYVCVSALSDVGDHAAVTHNAKAQETHLTKDGTWEMHPQHKTKTIKNELNPVFDEDFVLSHVLCRPQTCQQQARRCPGARGPQRTGCAVRDTRRT